MSDTTKAIVSPQPDQGKRPKWDKWEWALVVIAIIAAINMMSINAGALDLHSPWLDWWTAWQLAPAAYWCDWVNVKCQLGIDMVIAALNPLLVIIIGLIRAMQPGTSQVTTDQAGPQ